MHSKPKQRSPLRPLSSVLLTLALGGCGLPGEPQPSESHATKAQDLALPPGLAPSLVKDIQVGHDPHRSHYSTGSWSSSVKPVTARSALYFSTTSQELGGRDSELWRTDGTTEGTRLVRDFNLGQSDTVINHLAAVGDAVYLVTEGQEGSFLWRSDGTAEGTREVRYSGGAVTGIARLASCGDQLFFFGTGPQGANLWKSDGTPEGTLALNTSTWLDGAIEPLCANGTLFFLALDDFGERVLWTSDGTPEGTRSLRPVGHVFPNWDRSPNFVTTGSRVFLNTNGYSGAAIWTSDGTSAGTVPLVATGPEARMYFPQSLTVVGQTLYFTAFNSSWTTQLFKSDGTPEGTVGAMELLEPVWSARFAALGDSLLLSMNDLLLRSDGTAEGTVLIKNLYTYDYPTFTSPLLGNQLFFSAQEDYSQEPKLWVTDGTPAGTHSLQAADGRVPHVPVSFTRLGERMVFWADDGIHGREPWVTDGTAEGTRMLRDVFRADASNPASPTDMGGTLFFSASDAAHGRELWKSDGTPEGTVLVKDIGPGHQERGPESLTPVGGTLFFFHGSALWKSDGTEAGTIFLHNRSSNSHSHTGSLGSTFFFSTWTPALGWELWKSDGTPEGTALFKDLNPGSRSADPGQLTRVGNSLFFTATTSTHGSALWKTDGTPEGTVLVKDVNPSIWGGSLGSLVDVGGTLFFLADDGVHGRELWKSDGTPEGTVLVKDLVSHPWSYYSYSGLVARGGTLFFVADDGVHGLELWKSDGTAEGTVLVRDISPGPGSAFHQAYGYGPSPLNVIGENIYFAADDGIHGYELWKSDGTPEGTVLVGDLNPGPRGSGIVGTSLVPVGPHGGFAFSATEGVSGMEPWMSDGTAEGTRRLLDVAEGTKGSSPLELTVSGSRLFFVADDGVHGRELWSVKHAAFKSR